MYAVNQCSNPRSLLSAGDKTYKIRVLSVKISIDAKAINSDVDQCPKRAEYYF